MRAMMMTAALALMGAMPSPARSQATATAPVQSAPVEYDIAFPRPDHHEAQVSVTYRGLPAGPVRFQMARSSPGRYALHEFAKNVYSVSAIDGAGRPIAVTRRDPCHCHRTLLLEAVGQGMTVVDLYV